MTDDPTGKTSQDPSAPAASAGRAKSFVVAMDGPAASGKGTIARRLAARYGFAHLDTGLLYRAVGAKLARRGLLEDQAAAIETARGLSAADLETPGLRDSAAGEAASKVAAIPEVREALLDYQRQFAARPPGGARGAVLDGRDIGEVICPDADVKLFVTASLDERARRRWTELAKTDPALTYETVLADIRARDARDAARETAPMRQAADAILLDTDGLDIEAAVAAAAAIVERRLGADRAD